MRSKKTALFTTLIISLLLSGCKDKGDDFLGKWKSVNPKNERAVVIIDINKNGDIFHIDVENQRPDTFDGKTIKVDHRRLEAKAESDDVLSLINTPSLAASGGATLRLENNTISFSKKTFTKMN